MSCERIVSAVYWRKIGGDVRRGVLWRVAEAISG